MRVNLFNLPVDILTREETVARAVDAMASGQRCQHVALNVAKLVNARTDTDLAQDIRDSDIVGIDGMGIVYALRLLAYRVPHRVSGVDLLEDLMGECARRGFSAYLLGARPEILERAERNLLARHPGLRIAGRHHGYFSEGEEATVCEDIRRSGAHCLFIAMPTPRKEHFMRRHRDAIGVPFVMGVGGAFDVVAGQVRRAPRLMQDLGLEWLFRLLQEPRRMAGRYLRTNAIFAGLMLRVMAASLARPRAR